MFGALPASFLIDYMSSVGAYHQLPLFKTPPHLKIKEEYLCSLNEELSFEYNEYGSKSSIMGSCDHPSFTRLRKYLSDNGYIQMVTNYCNGDSVLNEFFLNDKLFEIGDKFPCGVAMKFHLKHKTNDFSKKPFFTEFSKSLSVEDNFNW